MHIFQLGMFQTKTKKTHRQGYKKYLCFLMACMSSYLISDQDFIGQKLYFGTFFFKIYQNKKSFETQKI